MIAAEAPSSSSRAPQRDEHLFRFPLYLHATRSKRFFISHLAPFSPCASSAASPSSFLRLRPRRGKDDGEQAAEQKSRSARGCIGADLPASYYSRPVI